VIAHGGQADVLAGVTPCIDVVDSNLILAGLRIAYQRLRGEQRPTQRRTTRRESGRDGK
jgi:hypothetical protein